jgi:hypothetical protein
MSRRTIAKVKQREAELAAKKQLVTAKPTYPQEVKAAEQEASKPVVKKVAKKK